MLQCIRAAQSTTLTPHTSLEQSPLHHCNTVISQNLADTRVGTSTGGVHKVHASTGHYRASHDALGHNSAHCTQTNGYATQHAMKFAF